MTRTPLLAALLMLPALSQAQTVGYPGYGGTTVQQPNTNAAPPKISDSPGWGGALGVPWDTPTSLADQAGARATELAGQAATNAAQGVPAAEALPPIVVQCQCPSAQPQVQSLQAPSQNQAGQAAEEPPAAYYGGVGDQAAPDNAQASGGQAGGQSQSTGQAPGQPSS